MKKVNKKAVVISQGFHGPWNMGEAVYARNFVEILSEIYAGVIVFSSIDRKRGGFARPKNVQIRYEYERSELNTLFELEKNIDYHFLNASPFNYLKKILTKGNRSRVYAYQFSPNLFKHGIPARPTGLIFLSRITPLEVITTSIDSYSLGVRIGGKYFYYVPAPIGVPSHVEKVQRDEGEPLRILYIGHGRYSRFPYKETFRVLNQLSEGGSEFELRVIISEVDYCDYDTFAEDCMGEARRLDLEDHVNVETKNIESEKEKFGLYRWSDIFLFPSYENPNVDPPASVLEAMSARSCVVATPATRSIPLFLKNRGIILDKNNLKLSLYSSLKTLFERPQLLLELSESAGDYIEKIHGKGNIMSLMRGILYRG